MRLEAGVIVAGLGTSTAKAAIARKLTQGEHDISHVFSLRCNGSERGGQVFLVVVVAGGWSKTRRRKKR